MEDDLNFFLNGRRPQYFDKWSTISIFTNREEIIFLKVEDDLNVIANGRRPQYLANGRRPQYFGKRKMTSIFSKMVINLFSIRTLNFNAGKVTGIF